MSSIVTVEIGGQRYPIRSVLDERYVTELAAYVDLKMRAASDAAPASDMLGLAVLVALNIADEFFRQRDQQSVSSDDLHERARPAVVVLLDQALGIAQDGVLAVHNGIRRKSALRRAQRHRAARSLDAESDLLGGGDLVIQSGAIGEEVEVIGGRGAPRES